MGACLVTWACAAPLTLAAIRGDTPSEGAMGLAGLSALGPTIAAVADRLGSAAPPPAHDQDVQADQADQEAQLAEIEVSLRQLEQRLGGS